MKKALLIVLVLISVACNKDKIDKPENLIPRDKMVDVLTDLAVYTAAEGVNKTKLREYGIKSDSIVFVKHNIDSVQFKESNKYYSYNVANYQKMFDEVRARLKAKKSELSKIDKKEQAERKRQDSIRRQKLKSRDTSKLNNFGDSTAIKRIKPIKKTND